MSKADKAGGCYGESHVFKAHSPVISIGKQVHNDFMAGTPATPSADNSRNTDFRPGGTDTRNVGGKKA